MTNPKFETIIIQGSARNNGNTASVSALLSTFLDASILHLADIDFGFYDYQHRNRHDSFTESFESILKYDLIVFATPVYWYSMSGRTKVFLDRITDFLDIDREKARQLKGKYLAAVAVGSDDYQSDGFFVPFSSSAEYLGMQYLGDLHTWKSKERSELDLKTSVEEFAATLNSKLNGH